MKTSADSLNCRRFHLWLNLLLCLLRIVALNPIRSVEPSNVTGNDVLYNNMNCGTGKNWRLFRIYNRNGIDILLELGS